jgi:hypothetical protein
MQVIDGRLQITRNVAVENIRTNNITPNSIPTTSNTQSTKKIFPQKQQQQQNPQTLRQNNVFEKIRQQQQQFQQLQQLQQQQIMDVPIMSKEQYKQAVAANYLKTLEQQQRIRNMKSTKMMFSNSNIGISPMSGQNGGGDMNRLFRFGK